MHIWAKITRAILLSTGLQDRTSRQIVDTDNIDLENTVWIKDQFLDIPAWQEFLAWPGPTQSDRLFELGSGLNSYVSSNSSATDFNLAKTCTGEA